MKKYDDVKDVKRKLHQIYGAYERKINYKRALLQPVEEVLKLHQSTKERLEFYDEFYAKIFAVTGQPKVVVDLACGLNPLSVKWMGDVSIYAYDIDKAEIEFLNEWFSANEVKGKAYLQDIICKVPAQKADIAFLLKTIPCLEQQEKEISAKIISKLNAKWVVISFPTRSIGGRVRLNYEEQYKELLKGAKKIEFKNEVVFILSAK
jgi:16S rRNA (guanine(1405)-N(7))-methyltransferase